MNQHSLKECSYFLIVFFLGFGLQSFGQSQSINAISIRNDSDFSGYELLETGGTQFFILGENRHNIKSVPQATFKLLSHLHENANVRILAIEQGRSTAWLANKYLTTGDTTILRQIVRNTMYWGKENYQFFIDLYEFNQQYSEDDQIRVESIDIEYKMESAILVINEMIRGKTIPETLTNTIGTFQRLFNDTKDHREQFDGLAVMYYYDKETVGKLVAFTAYDMEQNNNPYQDFFGTMYDQFERMIEEMNAGLRFDYTNPNTNYKFRDRLIYNNALELISENRNVGILCVFGLAHTEKGSSLYKLRTNPESPVYEKVINIRVTSLSKNRFKPSDLRKINFNYPNLLRNNEATLIKHNESDPILKSSWPIDYTLFINENGDLTPFENVLKENY